MANYYIMKNRFDKTKKRKGCLKVEVDASESEEESDDERLMFLMAFEDNQSRDNDTIQINDNNQSFTNYLMPLNSYMMNEKLMHNGTC